MVIPNPMTIVWHFVGNHWFLLFVLLCLIGYNFYVKVISKLR